MVDVGYASLGIIPSFDGFRGRLERGTASDMAAVGTSGGRVFGDAAGRSAGGRFGSLFKAAAKTAIVGAAALAAGGVKLAFDSVAAASDLEESTNKVVQVFGEGSDAVLKFTGTAADRLGQTNTEAREAAATFGLFANAAGLGDRKSAKFAKRLTRLASDLASFNNVEPEEAVQALGAALRGEAEPIRRFGVLLDEATLKAEALDLGLLKPVKNQSQIRAYQVAVQEGQQKLNDAVDEYGKSSLQAEKAEAALGTARDRLKKATEGTLPPLTQQQKLLAAQSQIFKQTDKAQGDFERTSGSLANQQRRLSARFEDAKARLGRGLLPIMTDAADFLLDKGIPAFEDFSDWFNEKGLPAIQDFGGWVEDEILPHLKDMASYGDDVAGAIKGIGGFIDDLPGPAKIAGLTALFGAAAAVKLRGGKGALGSVGSALGLAKPVPVYVTNKGFGAGSGGDVIGGGADGDKGTKGKIRQIGKGIAGLILADMAYEATAGDLYGLDSTPGQKRQTVSPFGVGLLPPSKEVKEKEEEILRLTRKVDVFRDSLFLAGSTKVDPKFGTPGLREASRELGDFIAQQVIAGKDITPYVQLSGYERAMRQIKTLNDAIHAIPTAGVDNGVPYVGGAGSSSRSSSGAAQRGGVNFSGPISVQAHDYDDFMRQMQRKADMASAGGRP